MGFASVILKEVQSSNISHVGYDVATQTLFVRFRNSGTYVYEGITQQEYDTLMGAESIGKHFHAHIRPKVKGMKLPEPGDESQVA